MSRIKAGIRSKFAFIKQGYETPWSIINQSDGGLDKFTEPMRTKLLARAKW